MSDMDEMEPTTSDGDDETTPVSEGDVVDEDAGADDEFPEGTTTPSEVGGG